MTDGIRRLNTFGKSGAFWETGIHVRVLGDKFV